jgi:hypothetical protein
MSDDTFMPPPHPLTAEKAGDVGRAYRVLAAHLSEMGAQPEARRAERGSQRWLTHSIALAQAEVWAEPDQCKADMTSPDPPDEVIAGAIRQSRREGVQDVGLCVQRPGSSRARWIRHHAQRMSDAPDGSRIPLMASSLPYPVPLQRHRRKPVDPMSVFRPKSASMPRPAAVN